MDTKKKRTKWGWIGSGILAVLVIIFLGVRALGQNRAAAAQAETGDIVTTFKGDLAINATASGQIEAGREARLMLGSSGEVAAIYAAVGDAVQAGDPLLQLDTAELERAVVSAQQSLAIQEANLATLLASASVSDIAAAEANVASAQAALNDLLDDPNEDEITAVEANVRAANADIVAAAARLDDLQADANAEEIQAAVIELELAQKEATQAAEQHSTILVMEPNRFIGEGRLADMEYAARVGAVQANAALAAAQEAYDTLIDGDANSIAAAQASLALAAAQRDASQAQLDLLLRGATEAQIAAAKATLAQAKANLDKLQRGPSDSQITQMDVAVEQARISLQRAENNLAEATLAAPFAGVVTAVHVNEGELANGILVEMVDSSSLELVLAVDEVDIGDIRVGQTAVITLETWPDEEIAGEVMSIAPQANATFSALVTYDVFLNLDETDLPIRVGMTADASLATADYSDILLVPNAAINADREKGTYSVNLVTTDSSGRQTMTETAVSIGLRDGRYTQIIDGLAEGDQLLVGNALPTQSFGPGSDNEGRRPPFGG